MFEKWVICRTETFREEFTFPRALLLSEECWIFRLMVRSLRRQGVNNQKAEKLPHPQVDSCDASGSDVKLLPKLGLHSN